MGNCWSSTVNTGEVPSAAVWVDLGADSLRTWPLIVLERIQRQEQQQQQQRHGGNGSVDERFLVSDLRRTIDLHLLRAIKQRGKCTPSAGSCCNHCMSICDRCRQTPVTNESDIAQFAHVRDVIVNAVPALLNLLRQPYGTRFSLAKIPTSNVRHFAHSIPADALTTTMAVTAQFSARRATPNHHVAAALTSSLSSTPNEPSTPGQSVSSSLEDQLVFNLILAGRQETLQVEDWPWLVQVALGLLAVWNDFSQMTDAQRTRLIQMAMTAVPLALQVLFPDGGLLVRIVQIALPILFSVYQQVQLRHHPHPAAASGVGSLPSSSAAGSITSATAAAAPVTPVFTTPLQTAREGESSDRQRQYWQWTQSEPQECLRLFLEEHLV